MEKILITGSMGMLGSDIVKIWAYEYDTIGVDIGDFDITNIDRVIENIKMIKPSLIIHCAAYTNVDGAESNEKLAYKINVTGTENLALAAREVGSEFIYISTDFVFDGKKKHPYIETDLPNPISVYGKTKYEGEKKVREILDKYYIIRISWLYGRNGKNFVYTIRNAAKERSELTVVNDQWGTPTFTLDIAYNLMRIYKNKIYSIYHLTGEGETTWFEFAKEILRLYKIDTPVKPISSKELKRPARRPTYSVLENKNLYEYCGAKMPYWKDSLKSFIENYSL